MADLPDSASKERLIFEVFDSRDRRRFSVSWAILSGNLALYATVLFFRDRTGMTQQQIGDTLGVERSTVTRDLNVKKHNDDPPATITNSRGQQRPATYHRRPACWDGGPLVRGGSLVRGGYFSTRGYYTRARFIRMTGRRFG